MVRMCRYSRVECKQGGGTFFWYEVAHGAQHLHILTYGPVRWTQTGTSVARLFFPLTAALPSIVAGCSCSVLSRPTSHKARMLKSSVDERRLTTRRSTVYLNGNERDF